MTVGTGALESTSDYVEAGRNLLPYMCPTYANMLRRRLSDAQEAVRRYEVAVESADLLLAAASLSASVGWKEVGLASRIGQRSDLIRHKYTDAAKLSQQIEQRLAQVSEQQERAHDAAVKAWDRMLGTDAVRTDAKFMKRRPGQYYAGRYRTADITLRAAMISEFEILDERIRIVRRGARSRLLEVAERRESEQGRIMALVGKA